MLLVQVTRHVCTEKQVCEKCAKSKAELCEKKSLRFLYTETVRDPILTKSNLTEMKAGFGINNQTYMKQSFSVQVNFTFLFLHYYIKNVEIPDKNCSCKTEVLAQQTFLHRIEKIQQCGLRLSFTRQPFIFNIASYQQQSQPRKFYCTFSIGAQKR